jgi:hypothetical protein
MLALANASARFTRGGAIAFGISVALCRRVLAEGLRGIFQKGRFLD